MISKNAPFNASPNIREHYHYAMVRMHVHSGRIWFVYFCKATPKIDNILLHICLSNLRYMDVKQTENAHHIYQILYGISSTKPYGIALYI